MEAAMEHTRDAAAVGAAAVEKQPMAPMASLAPHNMVHPAAFNPFKDKPNLNLFYSKVHLQPSKLLMDAEGCLLLPAHMEKWPSCSDHSGKTASCVFHERLCYGLDEMLEMSCEHASPRLHSLYSEYDSLRCSLCPEVLWPLVNDDFLGFQKHNRSVGHLRNLNRCLKSRGRALVPIEGEVPKELPESAVDALRTKLEFITAEFPDDLVDAVQEDGQLGIRCNDCPGRLYPAVRGSVVSFRNHLYANIHREKVAARVRDRDRLVQGEEARANWVKLAPSLNEERVERLKESKYLLDQEQDQLKEQELHLQNEQNELKVKTMIIQSERGRLKIQELQINEEQAQLREREQRLQRELDRQREQELRLQQELDQQRDNVLRLEDERANLPMTALGTSSQTSYQDDFIQKPAERCPVCDGDMTGASPTLITQHVNGCLDGNPVPLPVRPPTQTFNPVLYSKITALEDGIRARDANIASLEARCRELSAFYNPSFRTEMQHSTRTIQAQPDGCQTGMRPSTREEQSQPDAEDRAAKRRRVKMETAH